MKNRTELWKSYREEIERNSALQMAVLHSDQKLTILRKRLLKVLPDYDTKFPTKLSVFQAKVDAMEAAPHYDLSRLDELISNFDFFDDSTTSLKLIEEIDFSTHELDQIVAKIKKGKNINADYVNLAGQEKVKKPVLEKVELTQRIKRLRIAIDGPSGSGKSTVAKLIAKKYGLNYINTGLIYRAIAYFVLRERIIPTDETTIAQHLTRDFIILKPNEEVILLGENVTKLLRSDIVSKTASQVAALASVRKYALTISQQYAEVPGTIMDGRDTTFKIMPTADLKIFLDTAPEVRAKRRLEENRTLGYSVDYDKILQEIKDRDHRDRTRAVDPLHQTKDAILIDSSDKNIEEVLKEVDQLIRKI